MWKITKNVEDRNKVGTICDEELSNSQVIWTTRERERDEHMTDDMLEKSKRLS